MQIECTFNVHLVPSVGTPLDFQTKQSKATDLSKELLRQDMDPRHTAYWADAQQNKLRTKATQHVHNMHVHICMYIPIVYILVHIIPFY